MTDAAPPDATLPAATPPPRAVRRESLWDRFFFEPESPSPIALVRAAWGFAAAVWAITLFPDIDPFLTDGALRYERARGAGSWNPLDWVGWSKAPLLACALLLVAAVATMVGYRARLSSAVAVLCMLALQRTNTTVFNSGDLVLRQIGIAVALAPSGLVLSLDAVRARRRRAALEPEPEPEPAPAPDAGAAPGVAPDAAVAAPIVEAPARAPWALRLLQLEIAVGYLLSCWAKLRGSTWHDGTALALALRISDLNRLAPPASVFHEATLLNALTWATLLFEGSFLFLVWNRRLRPWVLWTGVAFHLGIDLFFDVGFFSWAMWIAYLAFLPPETADRVVAWLRVRLGGPAAARASRGARRSPGGRAGGGAPPR